MKLARKPLVAPPFEDQRFYTPIGTIDVRFVPNEKAVMIYRTFTGFDLESLSEYIELLQEIKEELK